jgi:hypothetical protein
MAGNRKHGIGGIGILGLILMMSGSVFLVAFLAAGNAGVGVPIGASQIGLGVVFLNVGMAAARKAASTGAGAAAQPPDGGKSAEPGAAPGRRGR